MDIESALDGALESIKEEIASENISKVVDSFKEGGLDEVSKKAKEIVAEVLADEN